MQYRKDRQGRDLSVLGFGCMRFARKGAGIDMEKTKEQIVAAVDLGINYFDTAYIYPGSENALGQILSETGLRDRVCIATKLPQYLIQNASAADRYFSEQLRRLRTDHIDYYLLHHLTDPASWQKLCGLGIREWIARKKAEGAISRIGFSFHGCTDDFIAILNAYDWDFCQIQYNYMDENSQAGRRGLMAAAEKGVPVIIMEPLRGGRLVSLLPEKAKRALQESPAHYSAAEIAFRWLWDQPQVTTVLSGMNSMDMLRENCRIACDAQPGSLTAQDMALIDTLRQAIDEKIRVGCTGCGYCMPCPQGVDIPTAFRCYNEMYTERKSGGRREYMQTVGMRKKTAFPSQCVRCGRCEKLCPQKLPIMDELKNADRALRPPVYRLAGAVVRKWLYLKHRPKTDT